MNQDVKKKWLSALRSGEYRQGKSVLHNGDSFCCLGVLCDIAEKDGVVESRKGRNSEVFYYFEESGSHGEASVLPDSVAEWAGLEVRNPMIKGYRLSDWNDLGNEPFDKIADMIEKFL